MGMTKKSIYVETSVLSFLCADPSTIQKTLEKQRDTLMWWNRDRQNFLLCLSDEVMIEAAKGDPEFARRRLEKAAELQLILVNSADRTLAREFVARHLLPPDSLVDATHLAITVRRKFDVLLTWNVKHLANPYVLPLVYNFLRQAGMHVPVILTPAALLESE
jgi:hypothetical protein